MSEWLTTGQMIDKLRVGEIAESEARNKVIKTRADGESVIKHYKRSDSTYGSDLFVLHEDFLLLKWRILPNYVDFETAMEALSNDKVVRCHFVDDEVYIRLHQGHTMKQIHNMRSNVSLEELIHGKWTIEMGGGSDE